MPSIDGRLQWDDDELTPGKKKEGGLHSTLFDADGNLKSSARFVPDEDDGKAEPETVDMHIYHEVPAPAKTPEQEAFEKAVAEQLNRLVDFSIEKLIPHAVRFWEDKARPALRSKVAKVKAKTNVKKPNGDQPAVALPAPADACTDVASVQDKVEVTGAEARARYMLALAARRSATSRCESSPPPTSSTTTATPNSNGPQRRFRTRGRGAHKPLLG